MRGGLPPPKLESLEGRPTSKFKPFKQLSAGPLRPYFDPCGGAPPCRSPSRYPLANLKVLSPMQTSPTINQDRAHTAFLQKRNCWAMTRTMKMNQSSPFMSQSQDLPPMVQFLVNNLARKS